MKEFTERNLKIVLLFIATIILLYALYLARNLFAPGILLNGEHPIFSLLLQCFKDSSEWFLPGFWCQYLPHFSSTFVVVPPLFYLLVIALSTVFSIETAYKIGVAIEWFFVPTVIFILFLRAKKYVAAIISFASLLFLEGGVFGFTYVVLYGARHSIAWGLLILNWIVLKRFLEKPSTKRMVASACFSAFASLWHFAVSLFFPLLFIFLVLKHRKQAKESLWMLLCYTIIVLMLTSFWLVPFIFKGIFLQEIIGAYTYTKIPLTEVIDAFLKVVHRLPILMQAVGSIGILLWITNRNLIGQLLRTGVGLIVLVFLLLPFPQLTTFFQITRLAELFAILLGVGNGLFFEWLHSKHWFYEKKWAFLAALFLAGFILVAQASVVKHEAKFILTSGDDRLGIAPAELYNELTKVLNKKTSGRLLIDDIFTGENTVKLHPITLISGTRFWAPLALLTKKETVFVTQIETVEYDENKNKIVKSTILNPVTLYTRFLKGDLNFTTLMQRTNVLDTLNVDTILSFTPNDKLYSPAATPVKDLGLYADNQKFYLELPKSQTTTLQTPLHAIYFHLFQRSAANYFEIKGEGKILREIYNGTKIKAIVDVKKPALISLKQMAWPNWKVFIDGTEKEFNVNELGFMTVELPPGKHEINFVYSRLAYEYLGIFLTAFGMLLVLIYFTIVSFARKHT